MKLCGLWPTLLWNDQDLTLAVFPGSAVATVLGKGFLAIRKAGHLCVETQTQEYSDYSSRDKLMEVRTDVLKPGTAVQATVC